MKNFFLVILVLTFCSVSSFASPSGKKGFDKPTSNGGKIATSSNAESSAYIGKILKCLKEEGILLKTDKDLLLKHVKHIKEIAAGVEKLASSNMLTRENFLKLLEYPECASYQADYLLAFNSDSSEDIDWLVRSAKELIKCKQDMSGFHGSGNSDYDDGVSIYAKAAMAAGLPSEVIANPDALYNAHLSGSVPLSAGLKLPHRENSEDASEDQDINTLFPPPQLPKSECEKLREERYNQAVQSVQRMDERQQDEARQVFENRIGLDEAIREKIFPSVVSLDRRGGTGTGFFWVFPNMLLSNAHVLPCREILEDTRLASFKEDVQSSWPIFLSVKRSFHRPSEDQKSPDITVVNIESDARPNKDSIPLQDDFTDDRGYGETRDKPHGKTIIFYVSEKHEIKYLILRSLPGEYPQKYECEDKVSPQFGCSGAPVIEARVFCPPRNGMRWQFRVIGMVYARCIDDQSNEAKLLCAIPVKGDWLRILNDVLWPELEAKRAGDMEQACKAIPDKRQEEYQRREKEIYEELARHGLERFEVGDNSLDIDLPKGLEKLGGHRILNISESRFIPGMQKELNIVVEQYRELREARERFIEDGGKKDKEIEDILIRDFRGLIDKIKENSSSKIKTTIRGDGELYSPREYFRMDVKGGGDTGDHPFTAEIQDNTGQYMVKVKSNSGKEPLSSTFAIVSNIPKEIGNEMVGGNPESGDEVFNHWSRLGDLLIMSSCLDKGKKEPIIFSIAEKKTSKIGKGLYVPARPVGKKRMEKDAKSKEWQKSVPQYDNEGLESAEFYSNASPSGSVSSSNYEDNDDDPPGSSLDDKDLQKKQSKPPVSSLKARSTTMGIGDFNASPSDNLSNGFMLSGISSDQFSSMESWSPSSVQQRPRQMKVKETPQQAQPLDTNWVGGESVIINIRRLLHIDSAYVEEIPVSSMDGLTRRLSGKKYKQHIITMNVNTISGNFETRGNTHWVGLIIDRDDSFAISQVRYVNPMGFHISPEIAGQIRAGLSLPKDFSISEVFSETNRPQYARIVTGSGTSYIEGNSNDCGPFLTYALSSIANGREDTLDFRRITSEESSRQIGQIIRECLNKKSLLGKMIDLVQKYLHTSSSFSSSIPQPAKPLSLSKRNLTAASSAPQKLMKGKEEKR